MDWDFSQAGELIGALPSWDDVTGAVGGAVDTVGGWLGNIDPGMAGELMMDPGFSLPSDFLPTGFDPGMAGELMVPGGFGDFDFPSIDPGMLGELIPPGMDIPTDLLPSDFLPGGFDPGMLGEVMVPGGFGDFDLPSLPDFDWSLAGELMF